MKGSQPADGRWPCANPDSGASAEPHGYAKPDGRTEPWLHENVRASSNPDVCSRAYDRQPDTRRSRAAEALESLLRPLAPKQLESLVSSVAKGR